MRPPRWTPKQISVIRVIAEAERPLYGAEIARMLDINRGHVYPILNRLHGNRILARYRKTAESKCFLYGLTRFGVVYAKAVVEGAGRDELEAVFD